MLKKKKLVVTSLLLQRQFSLHLSARFKRDPVYFFKIILNRKREVLLRFFHKAHKHLHTISEHLHHKREGAAQPTQLTSVSFTHTTQFVILKATFTSDNGAIHLLINRRCI